MIEGTDLIGQNFEERRGGVGSKQASPVNLIPVGIVVDTDIAHERFFAPFSLYRDGERNYSIGAHDQTAVSIGLLGIAIILLQDNLFLPDQSGKIVYGTVIEGRENQGNWVTGWP